MKLENHSNFVAKDLAAAKRISKAMDVRDVKKFLQYVDLFNSRMNRETKSLLGVPTNEFVVDLRFKPLFTPRCVTAVDNSIIYADLIVREDVDLDFEAKATYEEWVRLQRQVLNLFKTSLVMTNTIEDVMPMATINSLVGRTQFNASCYLEKINDAELPVKLNFNIYDDLFAVDYSEVKTVTNVIHHVIRNMA